MLTSNLVVGQPNDMVRPREEANKLPLELAGYRFDLDGDEGDGVEVEHPLYSVDSRLHGRLSSLNYISFY